VRWARDRPLPAEAQLTLFGAVARLPDAVLRRPSAAPREWLGRRLRRLWQEWRRRARPPDPVVTRIALAALAVFVLGTWYFRDAFGGDWLTAFYFIVATITTTGYGDVHPDHGDPLEIVVASLLMLSGVVFSGVFIAFLASWLTRRQWVLMQGLRRVRRRGHIVVCGAGSIGTNVIDLLLGLGKALVVVEAAPDATLVEMARAHRFDLLTGDASRDATLDLCNLGAAHGLVALTNVDTLNLEIALGARARNPTLPIVLRIAEASFAASIARHFDIETTFSAAALAAPAFAGLSRFAGSRGRVFIGGEEFAIAEAEAAATSVSALPAGAVPLAVAREDSCTPAADWRDVGPGDRLLLLLPLAPFRDGSDTPMAAVHRIFGG
jgi:voltage-gated potassium channel Kch